MKNKPLLLATLVFANLLTVIFFIIHGGSIMQALWVYWLQSLIIGAINVIRIIFMPIRGKVTVNSTEIDIAKLNTSKVGNYIIAGFFALHYGFFHLIYGLFLLGLSMPGMKFEFGGETHNLNLGHDINIGLILISGLAFALHHLLSFLSERQYFRENPSSLPDVGKIIMRPYARIIPMHLIIIFGPMVAVLLNENWVFILFMMLKTIADIELYRRSTGHPQPANTV